MQILQPSPALRHEPAPARGEPRGLSFLPARNAEDSRSTWALAIAGLLFAVAAANLLCLSPRWYSNRFISLVYEPARFVVLTAATGAAAVRMLWALLSTKPAASPTWLARNLSGGWVFLPCFVLLYEQNSAWMLLVVALIAVGTALGLRRLLPVAVEAMPPPDRETIPLPSLNGLPAADSPLFLAFSIAVFAQASLILAAGGLLLYAALALSIGLFLFAWRWSAFEPRAAQWWTGTHPPLRQASIAILLTWLTLIPWTVGSFGFRGHKGPVAQPSASAQRTVDSNSGYFGIILYPPPKKKEIVAPSPHSDWSQSSALSKPVTIPFDGPYLYFKRGHRPGPSSHIAHGNPIDVNVRSTDSDPLLMEAHQMLGRPIDLSTCGEIDIAITNADTRPGEIGLSLMLSDSASPAKPWEVLSELPIASSQPDSIPHDRAPVKDVLRFPIPRTAHLRRFDKLTVAFRLSARHGRAGAKVSIDSFKLIPR